MKARILFGGAVFLVAVAVNAFLFSGCGPIIKYPSCGEWRARALDGATCRECVDAKGSYAQCSSRTFQTP